ncbi:NAD-dependent epimerase/dehydratase family protein (plasmid) [Deinococcus sp. KNUC1210]|uniref:NAD-dependent epimerase/dehydratase family protein n=1 Tax=Deinococcus sp. KNUC1210 TaxID=2917691 RepID=UPI001EF15C19|nr:NAD-dependent epimerase/dehydratase family protein [Deinococcus sp. KNUC1210]ULH17985.1 NAD-dependent epimerase/dehydratase family protein [Deinococcus sp. KNUC1210]
MNVFLTGATGYIGSVVAEKLRQAGHVVTGLARSDTSADTLQARGIQVVRGDLRDAAVLNDAAQAADGVINAAFDFDPHDFLATAALERQVVTTLVGALKESGKPLIFTSGTGMLGDTGSVVFDEETSLVVPAGDAGWATRGRLQNENTVLGASGMRGIVLRAPHVYGRSDGYNLIAALRTAGLRIGAVPYGPGTGQHQWSFVHVDDLAELYVLALEHSQRGELYYAAAESGLHTVDIARATSQGSDLQGRTVELDMAALADAFGSPFMAWSWVVNNQSSGLKAQRTLNWSPRHTRMLEALARPQP